jgi:4-amino-4-deoxy-L-arabinose transferase-like glycosyltransferase
MYTPAVMTEGVTASLIALAAWAASRRCRTGTIVLGLVMGVATLVRPQSLVLAPALGALAAARGAPLVARLRRAVLATTLALAVCAPWTIRNCVRMKQCALVSFNGGWNLLIGAHENATGTFAPLEAPEACRTVWDEAEKDVCFGREARSNIAREPGRWLGLVPAKLAATFDYSGAPGFYLYQSNCVAFDARAKRRLGILETGYERIAYLSALIAVALASGPMRRARLVVAAASAPLLFQTHAYLAVLGLAVALGLRQKALWEGPTLESATFLGLVATVVTHAIFFGAGRYSMVIFPLVTALAFCYGRPSNTSGSAHTEAPLPARLG